MPINPLRRLWRVGVKEVNLFRRDIRAYTAPIPDPDDSVRDEDLPWSQRGSWRGSYRRRWTRRQKIEQGGDPQARGPREEHTAGAAGSSSAHSAAASSIDRPVWDRDPDADLGEDRDPTGTLAAVRAGARFSRSEALSRTVAFYKATWDGTLEAHLARLDAEREDSMKQAVSSARGAAIAVAGRLRTGAGEVAAAAADTAADTAGAASGRVPTSEDELKSWVAARLKVYRAAVDEFVLGYRETSAALSAEEEEAEVAAVRDAISSMDLAKLASTVADSAAKPMRKVVDEETAADDGRTDNRDKSSGSASASGSGTPSAGARDKNSSSSSSV